MSRDDASLTDWLATPPGRYLLAWETAQFEQAVSDIFGYHALQLGFPQLDALGNNRMPHRWLAIDSVVIGTHQRSGGGPVIHVRRLGGKSRADDRHAKGYKR